MDPKTVLSRWDEFVSRRSLPYYQKVHRLMMRQVLARFPMGKLSDLSDRDLVDAVHADGDRSLRYFLGHLDRFLELHDMKRNPR